MCRGLGTPDYGVAQQICSSLIVLKTHAIPSIGDIPATLPIHSKAKALYFDLEESVASDLIDDKDPMAQATQLAATFPLEIQERLLPYFIEMFAQRVTLERKDAGYDDLRRALRERERELAELRRTMLARAAEAGKNMPPIAETLDLFRSHMEAKTCMANAKIVCGEARRFTEQLEDRRSLADVTPLDITTWIT